LKNDYRFDDPGTWGLRKARVTDYLTALMNVRTPEEALPFLEEYGSPFQSLPENDPAEILRFLNLLPDGYAPPQYRRTYLKWSDIRALQDVLKHAATAPVHTWISRLDKLVLSLRVNEEKLRFELEHSDASHLCLAQIFLERFAGREFGWCERVDCGRFYTSKNKHRRNYCSERCAHLVAVRRSRGQNAPERQGKPKDAKRKKAKRTIGR
jgi:hypothetical protein